MATQTGEDTTNGHLALNTAKQLVQQAEVKDLPRILFLSTNPDQAAGATTEGNGDHQGESCSATRLREAFKTALNQRLTSGLPELLTHQVLRVLEFCNESKCDTTEDTLEKNFSGTDLLKEDEEILRLYEILQMFKLSVPKTMQAAFKKIISSYKIPLYEGKNKFLVYTENKELVEICKQLTEDDVADLYDQLTNEEEEIFQEIKGSLQLPISSEILKEVEGLKDVAFYYLVLVLRSERLLNRLHTHTLINMLQKTKDCDTTDCSAKVHPVDQLNRYSLASTPPGLCIIFNVAEKEALKESELEKQKNRDWRYGSESDRKSIKSLFRDEFGYNVLEKINPTIKNVNDVIHELESPRYKFYDSLVVVFMAHGYKTYLEAMDGCIHRRRALIEPITKIKWLAKKPKLFFIQACRSRAEEMNEEVSQGPGRGKFGDSSIINPTTGPEWFNTYRGRVSLDDLNPFTDTLISFATKWYEPAQRHPNEGSVYINTLVDQLRQYGRRENILTVLTRVNYNVNMTVHEAEEGEFRQAPYFESSLQKVFVFPSN